MKQLKISPEVLAKRMLEIVTKGYFLRLITEAYEHKDGKNHQTIAKHARKYFGIGNSRGGMPFPWYMDFLFQAHRDLFYRRRATRRYCGIAELGFEDLTIEWASTDANSSIIYLFGFSDSRIYFDLYRRYIQPGSLTIDVGANLGIHTLVMAKCVGANGAVLSFEPSDLVHRRLIDNLKRNALTNVTPMQKGIGEEAGMQRFDRHADDFNIGKGTLSSSGASEIELTTIDGSICGRKQPVSVIKIDTEGHEISVIKGAQATLRRNEPIVACEFNPDRYSMRQFSESIPFEAEYYTIPNTYYEKFESVGNDFRGRRDLLIVPCSKKAAVTL